MPPKAYFYKDNQGNIKKFAYCCMCSAGPFKQSEKNISFITAGSKNDLCYCVRCYKNLGMKTDEILNVTPPPINEKTEIVEFSKPKEPEIAPAEILPEVIAEDPGEVYEEDVIESEPVKIESEPTKNEEMDKPGDLFVYMGQYVDGSYRVDITRNVELEIEMINMGKDPHITKLPIELIYYNKVKDWNEALSEKDQIQRMNTFQKEEMSKSFIKKIFEGINI